MNLRFQVSVFTILVVEMKLETLVLFLRTHKAHDCFWTTELHQHRLLVIRRKHPLFMML